MPPVKKPHRQRRRTFFTEWREFRELSQEEAAGRLDIDRSTLSRIESGKSPYNQDVLEKMGLAYGCDPEDLLSVNPKMPNPAQILIKEIQEAPPEKQRLVIEMVKTLLRAA